jgi:hypothetical protein
MATLSADTNFKLKALGIYQLIYAVVGLGVTLWLMIRQGFQFPLVIAIFIVVIALYLFSLYCGILCFQTSRRCLSYSAINQYLQLISLSIVGYGFKYTAGLSLNLGLDLTHNFTLHLNMDLLSTWHIDFDNPAHMIWVNLNIVALVLILAIDRIKKKISEEEERELLEIGVDI